MTGAFIGTGFLCAASNKCKQKRPGNYQAVLSGGDGGNRTRVRNIRPVTSTGIVAHLLFRWADSVRQDSLAQLAEVS